MFFSTFPHTIPSDWRDVRAAILPACHDVDRDAVAIWSHFYPLPLADAFASSPDRDGLTRSLRITGAHDLQQQIDTSHWFFYGHRFWPAVKAQILASAQRASAAGGAASVHGTAADNADIVGGGTTAKILADLVRTTATSTAAACRVDVALTMGMAFVGWMTLRQVGIDAFGHTTPAAQPHIGGDNPDAIVSARRKDDSQGLFGFLRGGQTKFSIVFDERRKDGRFPLINQQHLTTAAADDKRDYTTTTGVRSSHEGPIPCDCRSASCGTCWVGILGGAEKLSEVEPLEHRRLIEFGYLRQPTERPIIRLACMARAAGNVTLVIPTWHGRVGPAGLGEL